MEKDSLPTAALRAQVKSARRVLEVFELFDKLQRPLAVSEISRLLGYPPSSTSVLVRGLMELGYLTAEIGSRRVHPTLRIALLGEWIGGSLFGQNSFHLMLEEIHRRSGEIVILGMRNGPNLQYIHIVEGAAALRMDHRVGNQRPLFDTAGGLVILAALTPNEVGKLVRRFNTNLPAGREPLALEPMLHDLRLIRRRGYAYLANQVRQGFGSIAMPLPLGGGQHAAMVVSVSARLERLGPQRRRFVTLMREALERHVTAAAAEQPALEAAVKSAVAREKDPRHAAGLTFISSGARQVLDDEEADRHLIGQEMQLGRRAPVPPPRRRPGRRAARRPPPAPARGAGRPGIRRRHRATRGVSPAHPRSRSGRIVLEAALGLIASSARPSRKRKPSASIRARSVALIQLKSTLGAKTPPPGRPWVPGSQGSPLPARHLRNAMPGRARPTLPRLLALKRR